MPQNEKVSAQWQSELGSDWKRVWQTYLHTLGNLTLTGYNSEYSDKPFVEKRNMKGGFAESPLRLNQTLNTLDHWNEQTIVERGEQLASKAKEVWIMPTLQQGILENYKPKTGVSTYTIADHRHLSSGAMRELFMELRTEVLALDPCVTEEFLKLYVAYKAETNFVDVIPLAKQLRLSLNMPFPEIIDPKGLCKDVTNLGMWGNGDVEVRLSGSEELPYVMGLVRQSFERQMGNDSSGD